MSRRRKDPLRALTDDERASLEQLGRATSAPAARVTRARALLAVADGCSYTEAARRAGRRSGDAVGELVARFNREGLAAVEPRHGGGPRVRYGTDERERILAEVRRTPRSRSPGRAGDRRPARPATPTSTSATARPNC
jgi:hypothetical protein